MNRFVAPFPLLLFALGITAGPALGQDIDSVRADFNAKTGAMLAQIQDMAAVEEISSRLPGGRTLRQTAKIFAKNGKVRMEVEAASGEGTRLKFLTIMIQDEIWTVTPHGKMVKMDPSTHGGIRPDPLIRYLSLSIKPSARLKGKGTWEGNEAIIVDNGGGEVLWLDPKTMTPFKLETLLPMEGGAEWIFRDYRLVGNTAPLPHEIKYSSDSAVFYHHVGLVAVNAGLEDGLFDPQMALGNPANNRSSSPH